MLQIIQDVAIANSYSKWDTKAMTGEELLLLRRRRKLTQSELADRSGLSRQQISRLETGRSAISPLREKQLRELLAEPPPPDIVSGEDYAT